MAVQPTCSWNAPGHDPFMGDVVAAVDAYQDIPAATRARLQQRMARRAYDEVVRIRRDGIEGRHIYRGDIRDMHFGNGRRCVTVDRSAWSAKAEERGLVYCEAGHCILVPTVCRNVSRIQRADAGSSIAADAGAAAEPGAALAAPGGLGPVASLSAAPASTGLTAVTDLTDLTDAAALPPSQVVHTTADAGDSAAGSGRAAVPNLAAPAAPSFEGLSRWSDPVWAPDSTALSVTPATAPVPEPAGVLLWPAGLALLAACRRCFSRA
jgi:hypothetical protein